MQQTPFAPADLCWDATGHLEGGDLAAAGVSISASAGAAATAATVNSSVSWLAVDAPDTAATAGAVTATRAGATSGELSALTIAAAAETSPDRLTSLWATTPPWVGASAPGLRAAKGAVQSGHALAASDKCASPLAFIGLFCEHCDAPSAAVHIQTDAGPF